jgi:HAD superfamily hydrolase (TIGR01549 family)
VALSGRPKKILAVLLDCGDTLVDEATQVWGESQIALKADLIPGAGEMVREIKRRGYKLGLVADGPSGTFRNLLTQHGLYGLFDVHSISEEVGAEKPEPVMFLTALQALGIQPEDYGRVVMVGNHLARDIRGANTLGLISVWLDWAPRRPKVPADEAEKPRYTIHFPLELIRLIERLEQI